MVPRISLCARCTTVEASCCANSANTLRANSTASPSAKVVGTARTAKVLADKGEISRPSWLKTSWQVSAVATSFGVAAKVAGINKGWLLIWV